MYTDETVTAHAHRAEMVWIFGARSCKIWINLLWIQAVVSWNVRMHARVTTGTMSQNIQSFRPKLSSENSIGSVPVHQWSPLSHSCHARQAAWAKRVAWGAGAAQRPYPMNNEQSNRMATISLSMSMRTENTYAGSEFGSLLISGMSKQQSNS